MQREHWFDWTENTRHTCKYQLDIKLKLRGLSPHANYTDRAAAAGRRS